MELAQKPSKSALPVAIAVAAAIIGLDMVCIGGPSASTEGRAVAVQSVQPVSLATDRPSPDSVRLKGAPDARC